MKPQALLLFVFLIGLYSCQTNDQSVTIQSGMTISSSITFSPDTFLLNSSSINEPIITIQGKDIVIDFQNTLLQGGGRDVLPDQFLGVGIRIIDSKNVTLRNLHVKGYKIGIYAENTSGLRIEDCNLSYNYRQRIEEFQNEENGTNKPDYRFNEQDEWLNYGAAVYLKNCDQSNIKDLYITAGQNGLMLTHCNEGQFYNNTIQYNSGIGIGLYRSSRNKVMHNELDWNISSADNSNHPNEEASAGILCYANSSENTFAYNSATHNGSGFLLWSAQTTAEKAEGGCNDNLIYGNDFSHASNYGLAVAFSRNNIFNNTIQACQNAIWGRSAYESSVIGNWIKDCPYGIVMEQGQNNTLSHNIMTNLKEGIKIGKSEINTKNHGNKLVSNDSSSNYSIMTNYFTQVRTPLVLSHSFNIDIGPLNQFARFEQFIVSDTSSREIRILNNQIDGQVSSTIMAENEMSEIPKIELTERWLQLLDESKVNLMAPPPITEESNNAEAFKTNTLEQPDLLFNDWGPYNFQYPAIWLRSVDDDTYTFLLSGPQGNWRITGGKGFEKVVPKTGTLPTTLVAQRNNTGPLYIQLEFIGQSFTSLYGEMKRKGIPTTFTWEGFVDEDI
ncbi:MAG: right-handed parallel beta-helix repeat-containing protein [Saprospiraceae bacterium]|nr:right-handed parallel beta-helix repeat-containing protein [Saprospiraceae bacterium]